MGDVAQLLLAVGSMAGAVLTGIAAVIVALRSGGKQATKAAEKVLDAAIDEQQNERLAELEELLKQRKDDGG